MSADAARRSAEECVRHMTLRILRGRRVAVPFLTFRNRSAAKKTSWDRDFSRATGEYRCEVATCRQAEPIKERENEC
jgi:hypothetical protein